MAFSRHPELTLHHQFNPPLVHLHFVSEDNGVSARMRVGLATSRGRLEFGPEEAVLEGRSGRREHIRSIGEGTLLGRRTSQSGAVTLRYVLTRVPR